MLARRERTSRHASARGRWLARTNHCRSTIWPLLGRGDVCPGVGRPVAVGVALLSALATFLVLSGLTPLPPTHNVVVSLLGINALAALILIAVIAREIWQIVQARRHGRAGARLHVRIVGLFAIIAAVPTILVAIVATITLDRGLDRFFSARTQPIIENSLVGREAYLREHAQMIRGDITGHGAGRRARQAAFRFRPRTLSAISARTRARCAGCHGRDARPRAES